MKKFGLVFILYTLNLFAQGSGEPFFFETANGAKYIHITGHRLVWQNPDSTIYNIIYFSEDSNLVLQLDPSVILFNGFPSTVYDTIYLTTVEPLQWYKKYYWRIVEFYNSSTIVGPLMYFKTMSNPWCEEEVFYDDFTGGIDKWEIANDGGTCVWEIHNSTEYTLPITSSGNVLAADADYCGSGTTTLTTVTLAQPINISASGWTVEFDNDWRIVSANDAAFVETSINGGNNWETIWSKVGTNLRNTHETITNYTNGQILLRFKSIQPGWDWWWAIDNVKIKQLCPLTQFYPPHNLKLNIITEDNPKVVLSWSRGQFADLFFIYRKNGLPLDTTEYSLLGWVSPNSTIFTDTTLQIGVTYTYRVFTMNAGSSNEATAYLSSIVPVELTSFTSSVTENNVTLNWQTATETNNQGFEVQRKKVFSPQFSVGNGEWDVLSFITGNGTKTEPHSYFFVDKELNSGKYQYRLKQIDYDGTFDYSNTIEVEINPPTKFSLEQNYPNPFNPVTTIKFSIPSVGTRLALSVQLKVYDVLGKEVATLVNEEKSSGSYEIEFNASNLASGIYYYQLKAGDYLETKKMILLK